MSRSRRARGRPYQPLPPRRRGEWVARLLVVIVAVALLLGTAVILFTR
jgi:hypothetical protein